MNYSLKIWY